MTPHHYFSAFNLNNTIILISHRGGIMVIGPKSKSKILVGILGILVLIVAISGCTNNAAQTKLIYEGDLGGSSTSAYYIPVNASTVTVEISNTETIYSPGITQLHELNLYALNVIGDNKQPMSNYASNIIDTKSFTNITNIYTANTTLKGDIKSVGVVPTDVKVHIKIYA